MRREDLRNRRRETDRDRPGSDKIKQKRSGHNSRDKPDRTEHPGDEGQAREGRERSSQESRD
jgi:hypothetical protein